MEGCHEQRHFISSFSFLLFIHRSFGWVVLDSSDSLLPWHQRHQLFLSISFVLAGPWHPPLPLVPGLSTGCPFSSSVSSARWLALCSLVTQAQTWARCTRPASLYSSCILNNTTLLDVTSLVDPPSQAGTMSLFPLSWAFDAALISIGCRAFLLPLSSPLLYAWLYHLSPFLSLSFLHCVWLSVFHYLPGLFLSLSLSHCFCAGCSECPCYC